MPNSPVLELQELASSRTNYIVDVLIKAKMIAVNYEWASLPPGRYGQPAKTKSEALSLYNYYLDEEVKGQTDLHLDIGYITKTAESE